MPFYDRKCVDCSWTEFDLFEPIEIAAPTCPDCGAITERAWLSKPANVIGDEIYKLQVNGAKHPILFRSKIEYRRWLKANNYRVGDDGTAKDSKSASLMDPYTLEAAKALVSRESKASGWRDPDRAPIGITSDEGVIRYLSDRNRVENRGEFGFSGR